MELFVNGRKMADADGQRPGKKLSIVIPAYNEAERIGAFLDDYGTYFFDRPDAAPCEFFVVVNNSHDTTADVVKQHSTHWPDLHCIVEPKNVGKGGAIMLGFDVAQGDLVGFVDADGATPPEAFQDLVDHIQDHGMIIASRWIPGADVRPRQPLSRRVASRIFNFLVRVLFKIPIHDTQCGAKLLTRQAMEAVVPHIGLTRWAFDVDLLFQVRRAGFSIAEIPTKWRDKTGSKVKVVRASTEMFIAIVRLRLLYSPFRWIVILYDITLGALWLTLTGMKK